VLAFNRSRGFRNVVEKALSGERTESDISHDENTYNLIANPVYENAVYNVEPLEQVIDGLKSMLRDRHIVRLADGECTVEAGFIWGDLLTNLERTSDHCSNIATCLIDATHHNMNAHEYKQSLIDNNPMFDEKFKLYGEKYKLSY